MAEKLFCHLLNRGELLAADGLRGGGGFCISSAALRCWSLFLAGFIKATVVR